MDGAVNLIRARPTLTAFCVAALVHIVLLTWLAAQKPSARPITPTTPDAISVVLIEPPAEPIARAPEQVTEQAQTPQPVPKVASAPTPSTAMPAQSAPVASFTEIIDPTESIVAAPINSVPAPPASPNAQTQAIEALKRIDCARLTRDLPPDCPQPDPFEVAAAAQREQDAPLTISELQSFGPQSAIELWAAKNSGFKPISLFGEDNSIFIDPMAEGAYNAQRIRNGDNPIWDRDIENGLKESRDRR